jgi:hypothetical protein
LGEERKGFYSMLGEFFREAGVLIFVFANLDLWLYGRPDSTSLAWYLFQTFGATAVFMATGMLMEK